MEVPLLDLKAQYASLKPEILAAIGEVLDSQRCIGGPKVEALEEAVAAYCECRYAVGASSGTDAILNSLMSLGIGPGDEVITTTFTFFATAGCIARVGARPVFVDIDAQTYNLDVSQLADKITSRTKAIIPVHLFGQTAAMDEVMALADKHGLYVVEDAAQAIGSRYKGKPAGSMGTTGCFSFFPSKNLGGIGDGGMITTNDEDVYKKLMIMRNHGSEPKYYYHYVGGNFRLDPIQAAALLVKLPHLDGWSAKRRENAAYYTKRFSGKAIVTPTISGDCESIYNQYSIRVKDRDGLAAHLRSKHIGCEIYYPLAMHMQNCFKELGYKQGDFPVAEKAADEILALPIYPELTEAMLSYVADEVIAFVEGK